MNVQHHGALPEGHRLQEYRLDRVLGFGGFGITYLATDTNLDKTVAIKEYLPNDLALRAAGLAVVPKATECREDFHWGLDRFLDEAKTLARFHHPHLVPVYRFFEANGTAYMVMEYAPGDRLTDILRRTSDSVPEDEARALIDGLLSGLEAVHRAGYLHRDIKPANIIVRPDGTPVLIDFGAARQALGQRSQAVTSIVTPGYAPLEQYVSSGNQGPWTDIYAVAAVAHQIVTGAPPPEATARARTDPYRPLENQNFGDYSRTFLRAIDWALRVDEHDRPQSVVEFRRALDGEIAPPLAGSRTGPEDQETRLNRPDDPSTLVNSSGRRHQNLTPPPAAGSPAGNRTLAIVVALAVGLVVLVGGGYFAYQHFEQQSAQEAAAEAARKQAEDRARQEADRARAAEQARRAQAEREAAEKAAAEKQQAEERARQAAADQARRDREAADRAARERQTSLQPEGSQRAASDARDAAQQARNQASEARDSAAVARDTARRAREQAASRARAAANQNPGRRDYSGGAKYAGNLSGESRQGLGVLTTPSGYRYEGEWASDAASGLGVSQDGNGERYEGQWARGDRDGHGVYAWTNGQRYEGRYSAGKRDGLGVLHSSNGWRTEARWEAGAVDGLAVTANTAGQRYEGTMRGGKYDGPGVYTWADGQRYEGLYRDDKRNGYGILYLANGTRRAGLWQDGNLVKPD